MLRAAIDCLGGRHGGEKKTGLKINTTAYRSIDITKQSGCIPVDGTVGLGLTLPFLFVHVWGVESWQSRWATKTGQRRRSQTRIHDRVQKVRPIC